MMFQLSTPLRAFRKHPADAQAQQQQRQQQLVIDEDSSTSSTITVARALNELKQKQLPVVDASDDDNFESQYALVDTSFHDNEESSDSEDDEEDEVSDDSSSSLESLSSSSSAEVNADTTTSASAVPTSDSGDSKLIKKSVRFNTDLNEEHANATWFEDDVPSMWYTPSDFRRFKCQHIKCVVFSVNKSEAKNCAPLSYTRVLGHTYDVCRSIVSELDETQGHTLLCTAEQSHLKRWAEFTPSRVGLEKLIVKSIGRDMKIRRYELLDAMMEIQREVKQMEADGVKPRYDVAECMKQTSQIISRPCRLFARVTAQAQSDALDGEVFFASPSEETTSEDDNSSTTLASSSSGNSSADDSAEQQ